MGGRKTKEQVPFKLRFLSSVKCMMIVRVKGNCGTSSIVSGTNYMFISGNHFYYEYKGVALVTDGY